MERERDVKVGAVDRLAEKKQKYLNYECVCPTGILFILQGFLFSGLGIFFI